jgi:hypothetical protein
MSALHDWHRETFTKRTPTTLVFPAYSTTFGGNFDEVRNEVTLASARSVVVRRAVNALTPEEWKQAQTAFEASKHGRALATKDPSERREHCELWLLQVMHESNHPELPPVSELALQKVLAHHAHPDKVHAHKSRLCAALKSSDVADALSVKPAIDPAVAAPVVAASVTPEVKS